MDTQDPTEALFEEVTYPDCDPERIKALIEAGADVNAQDLDGESPLHYAASNSYSEATKILIQHGADVNAQDPAGMSPLHYGVRSEDIIRTLLENNADPNMQNNDGVTPLEEALLTGNDYITRHSDIAAEKIKAAKLLAEHGANTDVLTEDGQILKDKIVEKAEHFSDMPEFSNLVNTVEEREAADKTADENASLKDKFQEAATTPEDAAPSASYEEEAQYEPDEIPALIDEAMKTGDTQKLEKLKNDLVEMKETDPAYVAAAGQAISKHLGKLYGDHIGPDTEQDTSSNFYTLCKLDAVASYFEKANPGLLKKEGKIAHGISVNNKRTDDDKYNLATYNGDDLDGELAEHFAEAHAKEEAAHEKELKSAAPEAKSEVTHNVENNATYQPATNNVQAGMR